MSISYLREGIIVAAVVIFAIYARMTKSAGNKLEKATGSAASGMQRQIKAEFESSSAVSPLKGSS